MLMLAEFTMADFIGAVTSWFTAAIGWVTSVGTTITGSPILLAFVSLPIPRPKSWDWELDFSNVLSM